MARKKIDALDSHDSPLWPTAIKSRLRDGRIICTDTSVWLIRKVPLMPSSDAKSDRERYESGRPIRAALTEIGLITRTLGRNRQMNRGSYRDVQFLSINTPVLYRAPIDHPIRQELNKWFGHMAVREKICVIAVRLFDSLGGGGLKQAADSAIQSTIYGGAPLEDYDRDFELMDNALSRAGLVSASESEMKVLDAWWNHGSYSDTPFMPHADHLHIFTNSESMGIAERAGIEDCSDWPRMPGQFAMTFAAVENLDLDPEMQIDAVSPEAAWASVLTQSGALVTSVRGKVEPAKITRAELRRNRKRYLADIGERYEQNAMSQEEQESHQRMLHGMESAYSGRGAPPTLVDASIVVGFSGKKDFQLMGNISVAELNPMTHRQPQAMAETWLGSKVRANPHLHDIPATTVAASGINDLSRVGDESGALIGPTERDRQMAYLSPTAAANKDALPICLVPGATGSGKLTSLDTPIPTPTGWTTMGKLDVGDYVLGRNGMPVRVNYLSPIELRPDLYEMTLSDGQRFKVDFDHQFVVSSHMDRNRCRGANRLHALDTYARAHEDVASLRTEALRRDGAEEATLDELFDIVGSLDLHDQRWSSVPSMHSALRMVEAPFRRAVQTRPRRYSRKQVTKSDPSVIFDLEEGLEACLHHWSCMDPRNRGRWGAQAERKVHAARSVLAETAESQEINASGLITLLNSHGAEIHRTDRSRILGIVKNSRVKTRWGRALVTMKLPEAATAERQVCLFPVSQTLQLLAMRLEQQYSVKPKASFDERRMTVGEILAASETEKQRFAIHVSNAVELPEAQLPVRPYTLGAWLGDGYSGQPMIISDDRQIIDEIEREGYSVVSKRLNSDISDTTYVYTLNGAIASGLDEIGFKSRVHHGVREVPPKRIPLSYLRASKEQRLAVLQGLMDTDGTIDSNGNCSLALSSPELAADATQLIRSLGIKASATVKPAYYTTTDADTGDKVRVECKDSTLISFTTVKDVFRLQRKRDRLPETVRPTQDWIYIESIKPIEPQSGRCLTVDDPDATYLIGDFVPTSNTLLLLWIAHQVAKMGRPNVIVDPKENSDHSASVENSGGQVSSLDDLQKGDGVLDAVRVMMKAQTAQGESGNSLAAAELAASVIMQVNPFGNGAARFEVGLNKALHFGVEQGAECTGEALKITEHRLGDVFTTDREREDFLEMSGRIKSVASMPSVRAIIGMEPGTQPLGVAGGTTLIKVGKNKLNLPQPGHEPKNLQERVALALVRMMVYGSAMALTGREGVLHLDEAWTFLQSSRSEVERLGRLARSQGVLPILYTQRVKDAVDAELTGYISRGLIMSIEDDNEAQMACELFKLEATEERMNRITAKAEISEGGQIVPNFNSLKPLREGGEKGGGRVIRGSVALYCDLSGDRAVPTEIIIPQELFDLSSTNPVDQRKRMDSLHRIEKERRSSQAA